MYVSLTVFSALYFFLHCNRTRDNDPALAVTDRCVRTWPRIRPDLLNNQAAAIYLQQLSGAISQTSARFQTSIHPSVIK
jgi:hypothetical protein